MKPNFLTRIIAAAFLFALTVQMDVAVQDRDRKSELAGWGATSNPDGDCQFFTSEGALLIHVPGGPPHDLAAEINVTNAPRALQAVKARASAQPPSRITRNWWCFFAPHASPIRTVNACERPSGTMKTVAAQVMAT